MIIFLKFLKPLGKGSVVGGFGVKSLSLTMLAYKVTTTLRAFSGFHSAFIKSDGSMWSMGENGGGQLGINSFESNLFFDIFFTVLT